MLLRARESGTTGVSNCGDLERKARVGVLRRPGGGQGCIVLRPQGVGEPSPAGILVVNNHVHNAYEQSKHEVKDEGLLPMHLVFKVICVCVKKHICKSVHDVYLHSLKNNKNNFDAEFTQ